MAASLPNALRDASPVKRTIFAPVDFVSAGDGLYRAVPRKPVEYASISIAAKYTGLTRATIYRLYVTGFIEGAQPGPGKIIVVMSSLLEHIDKSRDEEFWTPERRMRYQSNAPATDPAILTARAKLATSLTARR